MKVKGDAPQWAIDLVEQVCKDYNRAKPKTFQWTKIPFHNTYKKEIDDNGKEILRPIMPQMSGGTTFTWTQRIRIKAGEDVSDQRLVVLHELAHHIATRAKTHKSEAHSVRFWKLAFELYKRYGVDMKKAFEREKGYKKKAIQVFEKYYA